MTAATVPSVEKLAALRAKFPENVVGLLPKVTCKACTNSPTKECGSHRRSQCTQCHNYITSAHIHLDYVGHAAVTDRLLSVDPSWSWEPVAVDPNTGMPLVDGKGNLWIRLTVCGVTRYGVGDGSSLKETIGDAIRNAAMRFGVALDLWTRDELESEVTPSAVAGATSQPGLIDDEQRRQLWAAAQAVGLDLPHLVEYLAGSLGHPLGSPAELLAAEAEQAIAALESMAQPVTSASPEALAPAPADVAAQQAEVRDLHAELHQIREDAAPAPRPASDAARRPGKASFKQVALIKILYSRLELENRDEQLEYTATLIGRKVASTTELTASEASKVIDRLQELAGPIEAAAAVAGEGAIGAEVVDDEPH